MSLGKIERIPGKHILIKALLVLLQTLVLFNPTLFASQEIPPKNVLVLASYKPTSPVAYQWDLGIGSVFQSGPYRGIKMDIEYLDLTRFEDDRYVHMLLDVYRYKYSKLKPDLIITVYNAALDFVLRYGTDLFPGIPVVFADVERRFIESRSLGPHITGVFSGNTYKGTLELALDLHPDTRRVTIVAGAGTIGREWAKTAREVFRGYEDRIEFAYLTGLPMKHILEKVANLPGQTVVIYLPVLIDATGKKFVAPESLSLISQASKAPVYSCWELLLGYGIVGGYLSSFEEHGKTVAELGLRILNGEKPSNIPFTNESKFKYMFDWQQLKRWSIAEDRLPPGSIVEFKELTFWEEHRGRIISTVALIFLQFMLITALLFNILRRNRAEKERDERLRFEGFISRLSSKFINHSAESIDLKIADALSRIGTFLAVDRAFLFRFNWDKTEFRISHLWEAEDIPKDQVVRGVIVKEFFPWLSGNLLEGKDIVVSDVEKLSFEETAQNEYAYCRQMGIRSFLILPIKIEKAPLCAVGLDSIGVKKNWSKNVINRLRFVGEICANSIERQHSEEKLKASELKYRTVADFTYDWEYWTYLDGTMTYVSSSCERISGYPARDFLNNPSLFREIIVPEDREIWDTHYCDSRNKFKGREIQFRIRKRDGEIRWIEHACQPVSDDQGNPSGFRASNRDVTKRKHYEMETLRLQSELAHVDRVSTIGTLTSALAHEINQPLTAMRSYAQAGLRFLDADQPDYDNLRKALKGIVADNKRASSVINHLRSLVKKEKHSAEAFDVNSMIERVIFLINSEIVLRNAKVKLNLHQNAPAFHGDSVQIQQVIINLLTNALDAIENQPVESRHITLSTKAEKAGVVIVSISDSGGGINPDKMEEIFNPFYTTKPQGLGLGLAMCRSIIEAHGGQLRCENNPDGGATFSFTLPTNSKSQNKNSK